MASQTSIVSPVKFGPFELDLSSGDLKRNGQRERLQGQPAQLLVVLVSRRGKLVTREELRAQLWPEDTFVDFDHGLNNAVNRIREVLGDSAASPRYIETIPRRGYRFIADVQLADRPELAADSPAHTQPEREKLARSFTRLCLAVAFAVVLLVGFFVWKQFSPVTPKVNSLAVLPFVNLSGDPNQEYFVDGMTEALIAELSKIRALKVVSRTSVMRYKGTKTPVPQIARELGVDAVIEGSAVRDAGQVRITVQLIDGHSDRHLWAESYQRDASSVLKLQGEMAQAISDRIRVVVTPAERSRLASTRSVNPQAYDAYLTARYFSNRWDGGLDKAIPGFERAVELDPSYAAAYANLALSYSTQGFFEHPRVVFPKAKAAALKALELEPDLALAHVAAADISIHFDWDMQTAEREWRRAEELDPNSVDVHRVAAAYMIANGRFAEAVAEEKRAADVDPFSPFVVGEVGWILKDTRHYDEALVQFRRSIELEPNHQISRYQIAGIYTLRGQYPEAYDEWAKLGKDCCNPQLGYLYAVSGRRADAIRVLNGLLEYSKKQYADPYGIAIVYTGLGDKDRAFESLNKAFEERSTFLDHLVVDPFLDSLRDDPRFPELVRRMGLPVFDPRKK